jgi:ribonuclease HII
MALDLSKLSVEEVRARCARQPVSPRLLSLLKRDRRQGIRRLYEHLRRRQERERRERLRLDAMLNFERVLWRSGLERVAGVDEAGVGPLAGPVVAAAVIFPPGDGIAGVDDSKRLDPDRRLELEETIRKEASAIGIGVAEVEEIDRLNVYQAALLAMRRAVERLPLAPQHLLVDARTIPGLDVPQNPFQKGDGIDFSIAAASILAKTHRDRLMEDLDRRHPGYGFTRHKGYATSEHQAAVRRLGPSPVHRRSFPVLRELQGEYSPRFYELKRRLAAARSAACLEGLEARLEAECDALGEHEQRKLRLLLARRWKLV